MHGKDRKSTRLNSSHANISSLSLHDALPISAPSCQSVSTERNKLMPIRLMAWNIQRFGINKMNNTVFDQFGARGEFIVDTVTEVNPDILVVIEVCTGKIGRAHV